MSYATPADLIARYDSRDVGDLADDTGSQVAVADLPTDPNVLASLADASGDIDSALRAGNRYTTDDLAGLSGNSLSKLKRVVCDIAMAYLYGRRPAHNPERLKAFEERAHAALERLRKGENIFDLDETADAGVIDHEYPTAASIDKLNLIRDRVHNYYPGRNFPRK